MIRTNSVVSFGILVAALFCYPTIVTADTAPNPAPAAKPKFEPVNDLIKTDTVVGSGAEAAPGKLVTVQYTGWLYTYFRATHKGVQFDSSVGKGPFTFKLGENTVIKGWEQGIPGMKVGGKRNLIVPSELAYGSRSVGRGTIPPNSPLVFDVELLDVK